MRLNELVKLPDKKINEFNIYAPHIDGNILGYNQAISEISKILEVELVVDEEKIKELVDKLNWVNSIERNRKFAQAISQNISSIVTVKKGE